MATSWTPTTIAAARATFGKDAAAVDEHLPSMLAAAASDTHAWRTVHPAVLVAFGVNPAAATTHVCALASTALRALAAAPHTPSIWSNEMDVVKHVLDDAPLRRHVATGMCPTSDAAAVPLWWLALSSGTAALTAWREETGGSTDNLLRQGHVALVWTIMSTCLAEAEVHGALARLLLPRAAPPGAGTHLPSPTQAWPTVARAVAHALTLLTTSTRANASTYTAAGFIQARLMGVVVDAGFRASPSSSSCSVDTAAFTALWRWLNDAAWGRPTTPDHVGTTLTMWPDDVHALWTRAGCPDAVVAELLQFSSSYLACMTPCAMLTLVRTALIAWPPATSMAPLLHGQVPIETAVLALVHRHATSSDTDVRGYALHALETVITVTAGVASSLVPVAAPPAPRDAAVLLSWCNSDVIGRVAAVLLTNWDHASTYVSGAIPSLFDRFVQLLIPLQAANLVPTALTDAMRHVLRIPTTSPCRYAALSRLVPHVPSVAELVDTHPTLLEEAMYLPATTWTSSPSPAHGTTLVACLHRYRQELEASRGLPRGKAQLGGGGVGEWVGGSAVSATTASGSKASSKRKGASSGGGVEGGAHVARMVAALDLADHTAPQLVYAATLRSLTCSGTAAWGASGAGGDDGATPRRWSAEVGRGPQVVAQVVEVVRQRWAAAGSSLPAEGQAAVVQALLAAEVYATWCAAWLPVAVATFLHPSRAVRTRVTMYTLRDLITLDAPSAGVMQRIMQTEGVSQEAFLTPLSPPVRTLTWSDFPGDLHSSLPERQAWALLTLARWMRSHGRAVLPCDAGSGDAAAAMVVTWDQVAAWSGHPDPETRVLCLELVAMSTHQTKPLSVVEAAATVAFFVASRRGLMSDHRKRIIRCIEGAMDRTISHLASLAKALAAELGRDMDAAMGDPTTRVPAGVVMLKSSPAWLEAVSFVQSLLRAVLPDLAPGMASDAVMTALDVVTAVAQAVHVPPVPDPCAEGSMVLASPSTLATTPPTAPTPADGIKQTLAEVAVHPILTDRLVVLRLLNLFPSAWDRVRVGARALLSILPVSLHDLSPRPGAGDGGTVTSLAPAVEYAAVRDRVWNHACILASSPRDREADGGAHMLRWMFTSQPDSQVATVNRTLALAQHQLVAFDTAVAAHVPYGAGPQGGIRVGAAPAPSATGADPATPHVLDGALPLPHGLLTAVNGMLSEVAEEMGWGTPRQWKAPLPLPGSSQHAAMVTWRPIVTAALQLASQALHLSLRVVAGSSEQDGGGIILATGGAGGSHEDEDGSDDEASSNESTAAGGAPGGGGADVQGGAEAVAAGRVDGARQLIMPVSNSVSTLVADPGALANRTVGTGLFGPTSCGGTTHATANSTPLTTAPATALEAEKAYNLVVGAWLTCRESCWLMSKLVSTFPLQGRVGGGAATDVYCISQDDVALVGRALVSALLDLKHIGCIIMCSHALQAMCTRLMQVGASHPDLEPLPRSWVDDLIARTRVANQFILRRSAGFAEAFLAILRAEAGQAGPNRALLTTTATALLHVAGALDGHPSRAWRSQVHALNILRLLMRDNALGQGMMTHVPGCMQLAVAGFTSPTWGIRNSCMMLFAATLDRAVGVGHRNTGTADAVAAATGMGATVAGLPWDQFFARFPALHAFLLHQLQVCTHHATTAGHSHPSLQPVLILLSQLRGGSATAASDATAPLIAPFLPHVHSALTSSHASTRLLAGRVLMVLTPRPEWPTLFRTMCTSAIASVAAGDLNGAHARFAMCQQLLPACVPGLAADVDAGMVSDACTMAARCMPVPLLGASAVDVASTCADALGGAVASAYEVMVRACAAVVATSGMAGAPGSPTLQAAASVVAQRHAVGGDEASLLALVHHDHADVRRAVVRAITSLPAGAAPTSSPTLAQALVHRAAVEPRVDVRELLVHALERHTATLPPAATLALVAAPSLWHDALACLRSRNDAAASISLLHTVARWFAAAATSDTRADGVDLWWVASQLTDHIVAAGSAWQSYELRAAAGTALRLAGLVAFAHRHADRAVGEDGWWVRAGCVVLTLLLDGDDEVRDAARLAVATHFSAATAGMHARAEVAASPPASPAELMTAFTSPGHALLHLVRQQAGELLMEHVAPIAWLVTLRLWFDDAVVAAVVAAAHAATLAATHTGGDASSVAVRPSLPPGHVETACGITIADHGEHGLWARQLFAPDRINDYAQPWSVMDAAVGYLTTVSHAAWGIPPGHTAVRNAVATHAAAMVLLLHAPSSTLRGVVGAVDTVLGDWRVGEGGVTSLRAAALLAAVTPCA